MYIKVPRDKSGIKIKYPGRKCSECKRYPCFEGISHCKSNMAEFGCTLFK